ncbi:MAG: hypothetical protein J5I59_02720 [Saprospiraceae bacterium]|nr:hypothetical protein [Saprospiraceae bacterium]
MDTTYWGRGFGVMLLKDAKSKENLLKYHVKTESNAKYIEGIEMRALEIIFRLANTITFQFVNMLT